LHLAFEVAVPAAMDGSGGVADAMYRDQEVADARPRERLRPDGVREAHAVGDDGRR
jgi:hypothetical protein